MDHHFERLESRRLFDAGQLDSSFGIAGHVEFSAAADHKLHSRDFDVARDGKIIVTALTYDDETNPTSAQIHLWRLLADGSRDTRFGSAGNGEIVYDVPPSLTRAEFGGLTVAGSSTAVQPDGSLLFQAGNLLYKYKSNGRLDRSFAQHGRAIAHSFDPMFVRSAAVDRDGRVIAAGTNSDGHLQLARIATNGKVDLSFAKTGKLVFKTALVRDMTARTLDDGSILVASNDSSTTDDPLGNPDDEVNYDTFNIKFNAGGDIDTSYGDRGVHHSQQLGNDLDGRTGIDPIITSSGAVYHTALISGNDDGSKAMFLDAQGQQDMELGNFDIGSLAQTDKALVTVTSFVMFSLNEGTSLAFDGGVSTPATTNARAALTDAWTPFALGVQPDGSLLVAAYPSDDLEMKQAVFRLFSSDSPAPELIARNFTAASDSAYLFKVHYRDVDGVSLASLGDDDLTVLFPDGNTHHATFVTSDAIADRDEITATYRVRTPLAPGKYAVRVNRLTVRDIRGNPIAKRLIGSFVVQTT